MLLFKPFNKMIKNSDCNVNKDVDALMIIMGVSIASIFAVATIPYVAPVYETRTEMVNTLTFESKGAHQHREYVNGYIVTNDIVNGCSSLAMKKTLSTLKGQKIQFVFNTRFEDKLLQLKTESGKNIACSPGI